MGGKYLIKGLVGAGLLSGWCVPGFAPGAHLRVGWCVRAIKWCAPAGWVVRTCDQVVRTWLRCGAYHTTRSVRTCGRVGGSAVVQTIRLCWVRRSSVLAKVAHEADERSVETKSQRACGCEIGCGHEIRELRVFEQRPQLSGRPVGVLEEPGELSVGPASKAFRNIATDR
jgi:hypothetical protein